MIDFTSIKLYKDKQLRDYQLENKLKIYEHLEVLQSVMLQMPTGTGKTRLFASIVKDIHNLGIKDKKAYKVLILAHRNELIKQISENVGVQYGIAHGKIMSKNWEEDYYPTQVASVQTLIRRLEKWGDKKFDFIIIDEAHHALAQSYVKICNEFPDAKILGVTATPYRMSKSSFRSMFDELIVSASISEFIKKGYLSEYEYYSIKPSSKIQTLVDNISEFDFDGDYAEKALSSTFDKDKIRANLLDTYFKYANGKKGIIYTINKRHNEHVCNMFLDAGIITKAIDSDTNPEDRNRIVKDFKNGNVQILCNVNIFSEGFDCPDVEFIQLARPTKSLSMYLQQVGRGFRIHEDKEKVIFLDNVGLFNRFGLPSANRKWLKHFNGSKETEEYSHDVNDKNNDKVRFIDLDLEEGNEEIELIFNSNLISNNNYDEIIDFNILIPKEYYSEDETNLSFEKFYEIELIGNYSEKDINEYYNNLLKIYNDSDDELLSNLILIDKFKLIKLNNKYGLINTSNSKLLLSPIYDKISMFNIFGYLKIKLDNKIGIYNPIKEIEIVKPNYRKINKTSINYNLLIVNKDNKYGIYFNGKLFLNSYFENILQYKNVINIMSDNEWLVYNSELIKLNYKDFEVIETFNKYDILKFNEVYGIGDKQEIVVAFAFEEFEIKLNKLLIGNLSDETVVVFDENFNFIIEPNYYNEIELLNDLFFIVKNKNHIGVLSIIGEILVPVQYFSCELIDNSFFLTFRKYWSAIDLKGKIIYNSQKKQITIDKAKEIISIEEKKKKIKELGYEIKKIQKEKNISQFLNKLTHYENCISNYDNIEKTIRLINVLREFNINLKTVIDQFENTNKIDKININSKITLAEYHFIKIMNEKKI